MPTMMIESIKSHCYDLLSYTLSMEHLPLDGVVLFELFLPYFFRYSTH